MTKAWKRGRKIKEKRKFILSFCSALTAALPDLAELGARKGRERGYWRISY